MLSTLSQWRIFRTHFNSLIALTSPLNLFALFISIFGFTEIIFGQQTPSILTSDPIVSRSSPKILEGETTQPPFTILQGNAIIRWEYRPGSTFYFVWQHQKSDYLNQVETNLFNRSSDLLNVEPTNIFMVKLSYWLGT